MRTLEVFYDFACPFCLRGHSYLLELLPQYDDVEVVWRPCEAHPRPESYGRHTDLCVQGFYAAQELGADLWEYHAIMYEAGVVDKADIENIDVLAEYVQDILDADAFCDILRSDKYAEQVRQGNDYAYQQNGVWAVPSFRMNGKKLDSAENVGVTMKQLADFLSQ